MSLRSELRGDVLFLTLDTPGASVNVLTLEAASSLHDVVTRLDPTAVRAVVLRSGKPRSFMNGTGLLMLSGTAKSVEQIARVTAPVREAYRALRACPVPTIAAIRGNCYGCGVELSLQCRYRLACDDRDTRFYMTELADYLMIPLFGATQDLPPLLGLERAVDFLLWGRRWSARQAFERGLVDSCLDPVEFDREVDAFVERLAITEGETSRRRSDAAEADLLAVRERTLDRIRRLPPPYRDAYATCFDLMQTPVQGDSGYAREALEAARSALAPPSKAATPFFFMRQAARTLAADGRAQSSAVSFETVDPHLADLCHELTGPAPKAATSLALCAVTYDGAAPCTERHIAVSDRVSPRPFDATRGVVMHAPFRKLGIEVAEVAFRGNGNASVTECALSAALVDCYFTVVRTRPQRNFVIDDLVASWLAPQMAYLQAGGDPRDLAASLRTFGFTRLPGDWVRALGADTLRPLVDRVGSAGANSAETMLALPVSASDDGEDDPIVIRALLASLCGLAAQVLRERSVLHVTFVDVAARDVIDFPLQHTSLCRYLTLARCMELLDCASTFRRLVSPESMSSFEEYATEGRAFYQGNARRQ